MGESWGPDVERECHTLVQLTCDDERPERDRRASWQALLVRVAPFLERWAKGNALLRRCALASEDDARAVVVGAIERMSRARFAALRRYLARAPMDDEETADAAAVEQIVRLTRDAVDDARREPVPDEGATPLRAWLLGIVRFTAADHVRERLGWGSSGSSTRKLTKRDLGTDAERLDVVPDEGQRPPLTDFVMRKRFVEEARAAIAELPSPMREAFTMWLEDASFDEIGERLGLRDRDEARALARAAQARLRERFRGSWPELGGGAA